MSSFFGSNGKVLVILDCFEMHLKWFHTSSLKPQKRAVMEHGFEEQRVYKEPKV